MSNARLPLSRLAPALLAAALVACLFAVTLDLARIAVGATLASRALDRLGDSTLVLQCYLTAFWALAIIALIVVVWQVVTVTLARALERGGGAGRWASRPERWLALAVGLTSLPLWLATSWSLLSGRWIARALPGVLPRLLLALLLAALSVLLVVFWRTTVETFRQRHRRAAVIVALLLLFALAAADALLFVGTYPIFHGLLALSAGMLLQRLCWREPGGSRRRVASAIALLVLALFLPVWPLLADVQQEPLARFVVARFMPLSSPALRSVGQLQRMVQPRRSQTTARRGALSRAPALAGLRRRLGVSAAGRWPDVIILSIDGLSPFRSSISGRSVSGRDTTPFLRTLARRGLHYRHAYAPDPGTLGTFLSLLSGNWQREAAQRQPARDRLLTRFRQLGYRNYCNLPFLDELQQKLGAVSCDVMVTLANASWSADGLLHFVSLQPAEQPVFALVHFTATHLPYEHFAGIDFGKGSEERYDAALAGVDGLVRRIVERLEERGRPLRLIITGDHGHAFGWHGHYGHNKGLYDDQVRVPLLLIGFPESPTIIDTPVSLLDLVAAFAGGVGADLFAVRRGWQRPPERPLIMVHHHTKAIVEGRYKLIEDLQSGAVELYDLVADPREADNLIAREPARGKRLSKRLGDALGW